ncbi:O-antigen polymerase [Acinetobacter sp. BMW17]|uniref:O-antigen polymerase n=1 Tax=Acinetobacter sp. BMW17 TaxID=1795629 RepID=UPI0012DE1AAD|nr:O-antigen polymerase [Acinetobacter sp. BMW17]
MSLLSIFLPVRIEKPSQLLLLFSYYFIYIPNTLMSYIGHNKGNEYWFYVFLYFTICISLVFFISKLEINKKILVNVNIKNIEIKILIFLVMLLIPVVYFYKPDFSNILRLTSLVDLYDWRDDYREKTKNIPTLVEYMFNWSSKIFIPLILLFGLFKKNIAIIFLALFLNLSLFVVSGHKSIFFAYFFILIFYFIFRKSNKAIYVVSPFMGMVFVSTLIFFIFNQSILVDVFLRRMIQIPGMLAGFYYEYFSENGFAKYSYNILKGITHTKYEDIPPYLIGQNYFRNDGVNANAGYLTSAYAEFGYVGGIFITLIVCGLYKVIDNIIDSAKNNKTFLLLIFLLPTWALINSAFITVMITHGLLLSIIFMIFLKDKVVK